MRYEAIRRHRDQYPIRLMCRCLKVSPSGFHGWASRSASARDQDNARLLVKIREHHAASDGVMGAPRMHEVLGYEGETASLNRIARLMRENGLYALHGYRIRHLPAAKPHVLIPNLLQRQFTVSKPNEAWVTDITYIRTWQGWLYLAVVVDLFSRKVVGWAVKPTIHRELVLEAVLKAVRSRRPRKTLIHSDQGTRYGSDAWRRFCKANHLEPSMSRRANCWDNAVAESFFGSLKKERIKKRIYADRQTAALEVSKYIEGFYNPIRRHSHLGGVSPIEFEAVHRHRRSGVH